MTEPAASIFSSDPAIAKRQMLAIVFLLTAFGHTDGKFDLAEKRFVQEKIAELVLGRMLQAVADPLARHVATERATTQFQKVAAGIDREISAMFTESVAEGESTEQYVHAKLALRCYELLRPFDAPARAQLLDIVRELIMADGVAHPEEQKLLGNIERLLTAPVEIIAPVAPPPLPERDIIEIEKPEKLEARTDNHPFFTRLERNYPRDPAAFEKQAGPDVELVQQVKAAIIAQREAGAGKLSGVSSFKDLAGKEPFLDGHVYVLPPDPKVEYELVVLGDLHGCYSCLKAALMQTDFLAKVQAHNDDPAKNPDTRLVLLGDYIDRGKFSYDGVLRTAMRLFVTVPDKVYFLRGNHEYYLEHKGKILAPVRPAEGMMDLQGVASDAFFAEYMRLFETMPTSLAFDKFFFVHAGVPRSAAITEKWKDLSSLNDPDLRFQMMWSDPSETEIVPDELQAAAARFGFGSHQLKQFLARIGCSVLVRGHERITEGFRATNDKSLFTLFSAGGAECRDLPEESNYREVTPMGLTIRWKNGKTKVTPFAIDWARFSDPSRNKFFSS